MVVFSLPVIALTAHAMAGDRERFLAEGFDDAVTRPTLDEGVLPDAIERCPQSGRVVAWRGRGPSCR